MSDWSAAGFRQKLQRYQQLGVRELVRFDPQAKAGQPLRLWDRVGDVLCERLLDIDAESHVPSLVLGLHWVLAPAEGLPLALRIARGGEERALVPTRSEARQAEAVARGGRSASGRARSGASGGTVGKRLTKSGKPLAQEPMLDHPVAKGGASRASLSASVQRTTLACCGVEPDAGVLAHLEFAYRGLPPVDPGA